MQGFIFIPVDERAVFSAYLDTIAWGVVLTCIGFVSASMAIEQFNQTMERLGQSIIAATAVPGRMQGKQ